MHLVDVAAHGSVTRAVEHAAVFDLVPRVPRKLYNIDRVFVIVRLNLLRIVHLSALFKCICDVITIIIVVDFHAPHVHRLLAPLSPALLPGALR